MNDAIVAARALYYIGALLLWGLLLFGLVFAVPPAPAPRRAAFGLVGLTLLALLARLPMEAAAMSAEPIGTAVTGGAARIVITGTRFGHLWLLQILLFAAAAIAIARPGRIARFSAAAAAGIALAVTALSGHAGVIPGAVGKLELGADMIHLLAAGAWLGGLLPFAAMLAGNPPPQRALAAARRFSLLGTASIGLIVITGGSNTWFMVGTLPALFGTPYGRVLLVKLSLFLVMVTIAGINRFRLTPRLLAGGRTLPLLRRNAVIEAALGGAILVVVAVLGTLPPAYDRVMVGH